MVRCGFCYLLIVFVISGARSDPRPEWVAVHYSARTLHWFGFYSDINLRLWFGWENSVVLKLH